jgi:hypothetical protein
VHLVACDGSGTLKGLPRAFAQAPVVPMGLAESVLLQPGVRATASCKGRWLLLTSCHAHGVCGLAPSAAAGGGATEHRPATKPRLQVQHATSRSASRLMRCVTTTFMSWRLA